MKQIVTRIVPLIALLTGFTLATAASDEGRIFLPSDDAINDVEQVLAAARDQDQRLEGRAGPGQSVLLGKRDERAEAPDRTGREVGDDLRRGEVDLGRAGAERHRSRGAGGEHEPARCVPRGAAQVELHGPAQGRWPGEEHWPPARAAADAARVDHRGMTFGDHLEVALAAAG